MISLRYNQTFAQEGSAACRQYGLNRFARIYPVYLLCTIIALCFRQDFGFASWVLNLTMLQGFFADFSFTGVGVGWSMTVELCFYALAPLLLRHWGNYGLLKWMLLLLLAGSLLAAIGQLPLPYGFVPNWTFMIRSTFFGRGFEFLLGIWLAKKYVLPSPGSSISFPFRFPPGLLTYSGAVGILLCMLLLSLVRGFPPSDLTLEQAVTFHGLNNLVLPVCIAALLLGLVQGKTFASRLLGSRIGEELGKGSYIFYLAHYTFGFDLLYFHIWSNRWGVLLLLTLLSVVGYHLVEEPLRQWVVRRRLVQPATAS
ncbi:acyltransferase family protein [Rufibacter glacialis]|uniref:Acyltransferase n=1 Tax=Rufibacter glacialis TaxID=1259555 RepID=A0A5M8Q5C0_9BACT|nr:acyltransferase family protein [Rufibacter glacialis]KAA6430288.1 acyltransferase [Rufibacter glacialis]GGK87982.1 acyltransferase [Rufibacter glacialis]